MEKEWYKFSVREDGKEIVLPVRRRGPGNVTEKGKGPYEKGTDGDLGREYRKARNESTAKESLLKTERREDF